MSVYTVTQVTTYLKDSLDRDTLLSDIWVNGEVSNLSRSSTGHIYFTLKDNQTQMRCVMFRSGRGGELLTGGDAASVHGHVSLYPARGEVQIYIDLVQPEGTGALQLELERLKASLEDEGLFDPTRKRSLPLFPRKVGVVTSPTGAVLHDICTIIQRRYPLTEIVLSPTSVQGNLAAQEIQAALRTLNNVGDIDVIIVARGGGSLEELWPFNEEAVARAIYGSGIPVISGVGHERDVTIADLVADLRAPTPSAAAELVVPDATHLQGQVVRFQRDSINTMEHMVLQYRQEIDALAHRLQSRGPHIETWKQRVDELTQALARGLATSQALAKERFLGLEQRLETLNPLAVLERGYAMIQRSDDSTSVSSVTQINTKDDINVTIHDGTFRARVV